MPSHRRPRSPPRAGNVVGDAPRSGRQSIGQTRDVPRLELREILEAAETPRGRAHAADRIRQQRELMALGPEPRRLEPAAGCRVLGLEPGVESAARSRDTAAARCRQALRTGFRRSFGCVSAIRVCTRAAKLSPSASAAKTCGGGDFFALRLTIDAALCCYPRPSLRRNRQAMTIRRQDSSRSNSVAQLPGLLLALLVLLPIGRCGATG